MLFRVAGPGDEGGFRMQRTYSNCNWQFVICKLNLSTFMRVVPPGMQIQSSGCIRSKGANNHPPTIYTNGIIVTFMWRNEVSFDGKLRCKMNPQGSEGWVVTSYTLNDAMTLEEE